MIRNKRFHKYHDKNPRFFLKCEICGNSNWFFIHEPYKICKDCVLHFQDFKAWEEKHGKFQGWKSIEEWEKRYDI